MCVTLDKDKKGDDRISDENYKSNSGDLLNLLPSMRNLLAGHHEGHKHVPRSSSNASQRGGEIEINEISRSSALSQQNPIQNARNESVPIGNIVEEDEVYQQV